MKLPRLMAAAGFESLPHGNGSRDPAIKRVFTWAEFAPSVSIGGPGFIVQCQCRHCIVRPVVELTLRQNEDGYIDNFNKKQNKKLNKKHIILHTNNFLHIILHT